MNQKSTDPSQCPLCDMPNRCAKAEDETTQNCWCMTVKFPKELLKRVPESVQGKACVCQTCLDR